MGLVIAPIPRGTLIPTLWRTALFQEVRAETRFLREGVLKPNFIETIVTFLDTENCSQIKKAYLMSLPSQAKMRYNLGKGDVKMTMVVAYQFKDGAVMIADSRATWRTREREDIPEDRLQKILPLGHKMAIGYAGDVRTAELITQQLGRKIEREPRLRSPQRLAAYLPRIARRYCERRGVNVDLILGGINSLGKTEIWSFKFPHFRGKKLTEGFEVIGSGEIVKEYLEKNRKKIEKKDQDLKAKADTLFIGLGSELGKKSVDGVGGMLQVILLDSNGISPLRYGFTDMDPDKPPFAKSIEMRRGKWIQHDLTRDIKIPLIEPSKLIENTPRRLSFHNFTPPPGKSATKWHLTYFLACASARVDVGDIEFDGVLTSIASRKFPISMDILAVVGLWGSPGKHKIRLKFVKDNKKKKIYEESVRIECLPEEINFVAKIPLNISKPGPAILECYIGKQLLGRRAMYFHKITKKPSSQTSPAKFVKQVNETMKEAQRKFSDEKLEKSGKSELVYLTVCQNSIHRNCYLKFEKQFLVVYWKSYPLKLRAHIASAFRMPKGKHKVKIDLVETATHRSIPITTTAVESRSSFIVTSVHGNVIIDIPKPGIYFISAYVDDVRTGSIVLAAETDNPKFSYTLLPEQTAQVAKGELLYLLKRSQQQ